MDVEWAAVGCCGLIMHACQIFIPKWYKTTKNNQVAVTCRASGVRDLAVAAAAGRVMKTARQVAARKFQKARREDVRVKEVERVRKMAKVGEGDVKTGGAMERRRGLMAAAAGGGGGGSVRGGGGEGTVSAAGAGSGPPRAAAAGGGGGGGFPVRGREPERIAAADASSGRAGAAPGAAVGDGRGTKRGPSWADGLLLEDYQSPMKGVNWRGAKHSWVATWVNAGALDLGSQSFSAMSYGFFAARDMAVGFRQDVLASGRART